MICYRDMTFCNSAVHRPECKRALTDEIRSDADRWWISGGGKAGEAPIAVASLCGGDEAVLPTNRSVVTVPDEIHETLSRIDGLSDRAQEFMHETAGASEITTSVRAVGGMAYFEMLEDNRHGLGVEFNNRGAMSAWLQAWEGPVGQLSTDGTKMRWALVDLVKP